jgi:hypothetical protein
MNSRVIVTFPGQFSKLGEKVAWSNKNLGSSEGLFRRVAATESLALAYNHRV